MSTGRSESYCHWICQICGLSLSMISNSFRKQTTSSDSLLVKYDHVAKIWAIESEKWMCPSQIHHQRFPYVRTCAGCVPLSAGCSGEGQGEDGIMLTFLNPWQKAQRRISVSHCLFCSLKNIISPRNKFYVYLNDCL